MQSYIERQITGAGDFVADRMTADHKVMMVLRSDVAHGKITALDTSQALEMPGVLDVLTAQEMVAENVGHLPSDAPVSNPDGSPMAEPPRPVLASGKVVYVGQPVAAVIADTREAAEDALEAIILEIDDLEPVVDPLRALEAPAIWEHLDSNVAFTWQKGRVSETDEAIKAADHVVSLDIVHPRVSVAPVETRACLAHYSDGKYELITGSQGVMSVRRGAARALGIAEEDLRVVTPDVGGSFAVKIWCYPEQILALVAARRLKAPISWMSSRGESLASDAAGRGRLDHGQLAFDSDGTIRAFKIDAIGDMGAFLNSVGPYVVTGGAVRPFGQCYDIPAMAYHVHAVFTNAAPTDAYRGAGKPESAATLERLIDLAAQKLGMDPFELRVRNLISPQQLPYETAMEENIDGGDFPTLADALKGRSDWVGYDARVAASKAKGLKRGRGVGFHMHATGGSTAERTYVSVLQDGRIEVKTGTQDSGQGQREALAKIAAQELEVPLSDILVTQGDSDQIEIGGGTGGSCLMPIAGNTLARASRALIEETMEKAAIRLEASVVDVVYGDGRFSVVGTDRSVTWGMLAQDDEKDAPSCAVARDFEGLHTTFPNGGYVVEVELDPETGQVKIDRFTGISDIGRVIDEPGALGQIQGGIAQAIGEVIQEKLVLSEEGQLLSGSMMDYQLPRADDMVAFDLSFVQTPSPNSELSVKGVGELPSIGAPGVLMNAIIDAADVEHIDKPITAAKIWEACRLPN